MNKINLVIHCCLLIGFTAILGCKSEVQKEAEEFAMAFNKYSIGYKSPDINEAEAALFSILDYINNAEDLESYDIDIPYLYVAIYVELYDLYWFKGEQNKATVYYNKAIEVLRKEKRDPSSKFSLQKPEQEILAYMNEMFGDELPLWRDCEIGSCIDVNSGHAISISK